MQRRCAADLSRRVPSFLSVTSFASSPLQWKIITRFSPRGRSIAERSFDQGRVETCQGYFRCNRLFQPGATRVSRRTRDLKWTSSVLVRVNRHALLPLCSARRVVNEARRVEFATRVAVCARARSCVQACRAVSHACSLARTSGCLKPRTEGLTPRERDGRLFTGLSQNFTLVFVRLCEQKARAARIARHVQISIRHTRVSRKRSRRLSSREETGSFERSYASREFGISGGNSLAEANDRTSAISIQRGCSQLPRKIVSRVKRRPISSSRWKLLNCNTTNQMDYLLI